MASVHRVKKSRYWFGLVSLPEGKRIFRSTGQTDEKSAQKVAEEWERVARGKLPHSAEQARRVLSDIVRMVMDEEPTRLSCAGYVARWLKSQEGTVAASTMGFYRSTLHAWVEWLGPRAERPIDAVQREDIENWRAAEAKRVRAKTANHRLKAVRAVFKAALAEGFVTVNPVDGLKGLRSAAKEQKVRRPFTRDEISRVLSVASPDWRLMTLAGLQTGQRLGDLARMDWSELDLTAATWEVTTGKTGHRLRIPLSAELVAEMRHRGEGRKGPVFPELVGKIERSSGYVGGLSKEFAHLLWLAGLRRHTPYGSGRKAGDDNRREQHELSFHSLRHTARTWLEEAGQPKAVIDALIGHEGDTGRIYTTVGEDALRGAAGVLGKAGLGL